MSKCRALVRFLNCGLQTLDLGRRVQFLQKLSLGDALNYVSWFVQILKHFFTSCENELA
jgi:hypothetical protein